ncbi:MAG: NAD(+)/NADH kinase [Atopobiaceae bacterium]|mgnify:CR=1 FL=1|nr:NAD(+)/NADH kinase [Atopobiaceae bacterium]
MRSLIIHNPNSGFSSDAIFEFERALLSSGDECIFRLVEDDWHAKELLTNFNTNDFDVIVLSGGDGTVSSLLYELRGCSTPILVFPSGTANLLAASIGNAPEPHALALACRNLHTAKIDMGEITWSCASGESFAAGVPLMAGTGLDAEIMRSAVPHKQTFGEAAYFTAALSNLMPPVHNFKITVDGNVHTHKGIGCLIANSSMIQAGIELAPGTRMDDGLLDIVVFETQMTAKLVRPLLSGIFDPSGNSLGRPYLESYSGKEILVESSSPMPLEINGEITSHDIFSYSARCLPKSITIIVDQMSPYANQR